MVFVIRSFNQLEVKDERQYHAGGYTSGSTDISTNSKLYSRCSFGGRSRGKRYRETFLVGEDIN
jgi:hypothetical protein